MEVNLLRDEAQKLAALASSAETRGNYLEAISNTVQVIEALKSTLFILQNKGENDKIHSTMSEIDRLFKQTELLKSKLAESRKRQKRIPAFHDNQLAKGIGNSPGPIKATNDEPKEGKDKGAREYVTGAIQPQNVAVQPNMKISPPTKLIPHAASNTIDDGDKGLKNVTSTLEPLPYKTKEMERADIVVLFVGLTGAGKSSACNMLCGKDDLFEVSDDVESYTKTFQSERVTLEDGRKLEVIDTMGLCDTDEDPDTTRIKITEALWQANDGVDVIIFCMKQCKLDQLHFEAFEAMYNSIFGPECSKFLILMITHMHHDYVMDSEKGHHWLMEQTKGDKLSNSRMRYICQLCHGRVAMVNNMPQSSRKDLQKRIEVLRNQSRENLLTVISNMDIGARFLPLMAQKAQEAYENQRHTLQELEKQKAIIVSAREKEKKVELEKNLIELKAREREAELLRKQQNAESQRKMAEADYQKRLLEKEKETLDKDKELQELKAKYDRNLIELERQKYRLHW